MFLILATLIHSIHSQVLFVNNLQTWQDAEADCVSRGSHLLTAQGNQHDIEQCIVESTESTVWIGLNKLNQPDWTWVANDIQYNEDDVNWANNAQLTSGSDCATLRTQGLFGSGRITNRQGTCSTQRAYCCNSASSSTPSTTSGSTGPESTTSTTSSSSSGCGRIRKEWNTASEAERNLYINGLLELSRTDKLQRFTEQHGETIAEDQAHFTSAFLPWHRQFLFELETQIRNLGGEYACFGLLYWNWGKDVADHGWTYSDYSILNSGLGSTGSPSDNYCVQDGNFAKGSYEPFYCPSSWQSNDGSCCLRRNTLSDGTSGGLYTHSENENIVLADDYYGSDTDFQRRNEIYDGIRDNIEVGPHGRAHCSIGDCGIGHLGDGRYSPDDPVFYLLHGYVDYLWALWQDYNDYEEISKNSIGSTVYFGGQDNSDIDDILEFGVLHQQSWSSVTGDERVRDTHSIQEMGYKYEYGSLIEEFEFPTGSLNANWFVPNSRRRRMVNYEEETFEKTAYNQLAKQYGDKKGTKQGRKQMIRTLAKMSCEYMNSGDNECSRPSYFDDCSDMERGYNIYNSKNDINITLDELIEKVADYPCMVETRKLMYSFVAELGGLWRLCRGDYDRFCDKQFLRKRPNKNQCEAKGYVKKTSYTQNSYDLDSETIIGVNNGYYPHSKYEIDGNESNEIETIIINVLANVFAFSVIILIILLLIWICYKRMPPKREYKAVAYIDDNDVEQK